MWMEEQPIKEKQRLNQDRATPVRSHGQDDPTDPPALSSGCHHHHSLVWLDPNFTCYGKTPSQPLWPKPPRSPDDSLSQISSSAIFSQGPWLLRLLDLETAPLW